MIDTRTKCLLLPLQDATLLLPNSLVAEIVPAQRHHPVAGAHADWLVGSIEWRRMTLPLISLESLYESAPRQHPAKASFIVVHRLNPVPRQAYYAICISGIPHFELIGDELAPARDAPPKNRYVTFHVQAGGGSALIPDLDAVEQQLDQIGPISSIN